MYKSVEEIMRSTAINDDSLSKRIRINDIRVNASCTVCRMHTIQVYEINQKFIVGNISNKLIWPVLPFVHLVCYHHALSGQDLKVSSKMNPAVPHLLLLESPKV